MLPSQKDIILIFCQTSDFNILFFIPISYITEFSMKVHPLHLHGPNCQFVNIFPLKILALYIYSHNFSLSSFIFCWGDPLHLASISALYVKICSRWVAHPPL
jgi:hypothetical protein